jgi:hypothetical protein
MAENNSALVQQDPQILELQEKHPELYKLVSPELPPKVRKMCENALRIADELQIDSAETYEASEHQRRAYQNNMDLISELLKPNIDLLFKLHRASTTFRGLALTPLQDADAIVEKKRKLYRDKLKQIADAKSAEDRRVAQEAADKAALDEAAELERQGESEAAQAVLEQAAEAPPAPVYVAPSATKSKGAIVKKKYTFRVLNPKLVKPDYQLPSESLIRPLVNSLGKNAENVVNIRAGGILVEEDEKESIRR